MIRIVCGGADEEEAVRRMHPQHPALMCGDGVLALAMEDDRRAGFAWVFFREIPAPVGGLREAYINLIAVEETYQRQGVGSRLVQACLSLSRTRGCYQARAYCDIQNAASHRLWVKNGFGIAPVSMDGKMVGSYVSYRL